MNMRLQQAAIGVSHVAQHASNTPPHTHLKVAESGCRYVCVVVDNHSRSARLNSDDEARASPAIAR